MLFFQRRSIYRDAITSPWTRSEVDCLLPALTEEDMRGIATIGFGQDPFWVTQCSLDRMFGGIIITALRLRRRLQEIRNT